jgi:hypothetical protein
MISADGGRWFPVRGGERKIVAMVLLHWQVLHEILHNLLVRRDELDAAMHRPATSDAAARHLHARQHVCPELVLDGVH